MFESFKIELKNALSMWAPEYLGGAFQEIDGRCRYQKDDLVVVFDGKFVSIPAKNIRSASAWSTVGSRFFNSSRSSVRNV